MAGLGLFDLFRVHAPAPVTHGATNGLLRVHTNKMIVDDG